MVSDPDTEARMETVAHRVEFLELLEAEGSLPPRDIVDALPHSRPTVTRALRELREADLVEQHEDGYAPTLAGTMAAEEYRRYETASEAILSSDDLLASIPGAHALPVEVLVDATTILTETEVPVRALEAVSDSVQRAETARAYLPTLVNTHLLRVWHRTVVAASVDSEVVFDPDLLTVLKGQYPHLLAEMAASDGFSAFSTGGPPYGIVLTTTGDTTTVAVIVYEDGTALRGILTNDSPVAVEWAHDELDRLRTDAIEVTADLDALSAAVADGVLQLPPSESRSSPSRPSGDASPQASDGHALPIDLEAEGLVRLSEEYFDAHSQAPPAISWRTGFTLAEVNAGHAVDRLDAEGHNLTQYLVERLEAGTDHVVLGPPGAGKSTICMAVACEWYDRGIGPVLYRERGDGDSFESTALLEAYLRGIDGHALVVVEDAVRDGANAIFEVMGTLDADRSVTFLLDARTHEWQTPDAFDIDARRDAYRRTAVEDITVPDLDERECERFVEHFTDLVDADLDLSGADLFAMIEDGAAAAEEDSLPAGDALVAQHYLARRYDPPVDADASAATALDEAVRGTYRTLADAEARLAPDLAVTVALLTAAGVPVAREYLHAVGDEDEYTAVEEAISLLEGRLLFEQDRPRARSTTYRTRHETWAMRFLEAFSTLEPGARARERFGRCVTRLLALSDEARQRERIQQHLGGRTPHLHQIEADPGGWADELVERIFGIGRTGASLAPLFGETTDDTIELPEACSGWTRLQQAYWRGEMNHVHGDLARAEREYRTLGELAEGVELPDGEIGALTTPKFTSTRAVGGDDVTVHRMRWRATSRTHLGVIASERGEIETAEEYHQEALALFREIDDGEGEATCLKHLGQVAFYRSDYDQAREYFEQGLATARDVEARPIEFGCLMDLGAVATRQSDYDAGQEYFEGSLSIARDLGERREEAQVLNNLGVIVTYQGAYDEGREYWKESLAIRRDLGDRQGEADSLDNLGMGARKQGDYDRAREFHEEALAIRRDVGYRSGEATSLVNLGAVALERGALDRAGDHLDEALELFEAIEETKGIAEVGLEQGRLALEREAVDEARERAEEALDTFEELTLHIWTARSRRLLGRVTAAAGEPEEARTHWRTALETFETVGAPPDALATIRELVETCREQGDEERAREWCQRARDVVADAPDPTAGKHRDWVERYAAGLGME